MRRCRSSGERLQSQETPAGQQQSYAGDVFAALQVQSIGKTKTKATTGSYNLGSQSRVGAPELIALLLLSIPIQHSEIATRKTVKSDLDG